MIKSRKKIIFTIVFVIIVSVALGRTLFLTSSEEQDISEKNKGVYTELIEVEKNVMIEDLNFIGTVESGTSSILSPKVTSDVEEVLITEGSYVEKGDILMKLDKSQLEASKNQILEKKSTLETQLAYLSKEVDGFYSTNPIMDKIKNVESNIAFQEKELEKMKKLFEGDAVSKSELDKVAHQVDSLKIQLEELKSTADSSYNQLVHEGNMTASQVDELEANLAEVELSLENTEIKAPYMGIISQVLIEEGELAMPNKPAVKLSSTDKQKIIVNLSEVDLKKIENDIKVEYKVGNEDEIRTGKVTFISSNVNPATRVGTVEIAIDSSKTYSPGSSSEVNFILSSKEDQILIPASSVKNLNEIDVVYIYNDGFVYEQEVELGAKSRNMYQILSGIEEGQIIASNNLDSLYDGTPVYTFDKEDI